MPDFDIDFCQERRDEVVRYVRDKYGADRVAQIMALGSLQARAAVRDAGRVLQMPLGLVDRIAKLIPNPPGKPISLRDAVDSEPRLQQIAEQEPIAQRLFEITEKIEGLYRHASTHPAGVVIGDRPLDEILPLYRDPRSDMPVTQFDYEDAEKAGLVKFDFLGLKTLTVIAKAEELLKKRGIALHTQTIDFDDIGTFEMLSHGDSVGVFQMEGAGHARPAAQDEARPHQRSGGAGGALSPGPDGFDPQLHRAARTARRRWNICIPLLEPILKETYGVMTYQDDVMRIARELAGYTMGEADHSAPRHGQEDPGGDDPAAREIHEGRGANAGITRHVAETDLRAGGEIRRLWLQQGPCRGLCPGRLSDGLSEGELSGRIPRRLDDAGYRQYRPAQHLPPGSPAAGREGGAARHQSSAKRCSPAMPRPTPCSMRWPR